MLQKRSDMKWKRH